MALESRAITVTQDRTHSARARGSWYGARSLPADRLRLLHKLDELLAVAAGVGAFAFTGQLDHAVERGRALVRAVAEDHAEARNGGGELEVATGLGVALAVVLDREL